MLERFKAVMRRYAAGILVKRYAKRDDFEDLTLNGCWDDIHHFAVLWPDTGVDVMAAEIVFRRLRERFPEAAITAVSLPGMGACVPEFGIRELDIQPDEFTFYGAPKRQLRARLRELNADVAIDLSPVFNPLSAYCCSLTEARLRVGFALPQNEMVYNYQIAPNADRSLLERYKVLASYIG